MLDFICIGFAELFRTGNERKIQNRIICLRWDSNRRLLAFKPGALYRLATGQMLCSHYKHLQTPCIWKWTHVHSFIQLIMVWCVHAKSWKQQQMAYDIKMQILSAPGWKARCHCFDSQLGHIFSFFVCFPFLTTRRIPYKWNQAGHSSRAKSRKYQGVFEL